MQPPPQALRFSHGRGERETRVTGDEPQGTMGRVQSPVVSFPPSFARTSKRDVWVRGSSLCVEIMNSREQANGKLGHVVQIRVCRLT